MSKSRIFLSPPHLSGKEIDFITDAFAINWIGPHGPNVDGFENDLKKYTGAGQVTVLSSGTAAIHLALILLDVNEGDVVICQSFTYSATANPIAYQRAIPLFVDSEADTWNMDPLALEQAIKSCLAGNVTGKPVKPKAIIPVHLYGIPAKMNEICGIADKYQIPVVEDAAEALGSSIHGKMCGSFGKLGILSFNGNKIITTSGGGALLSDDEELIKKARFLATQARDEAAHYQHSHIGYNYRMSNIVAGIGRGQMQVLSSHLEQRRSNFNKYKSYFKGIESKGYNVHVMEGPEGYNSNHWLTTIIIDPGRNNGITKDVLRLAFENENIESRPLWKPMHLQPIFANSPYFGSGLGERLFSNGLCLPSGSSLTEDDWERIIGVMERVFI